VPATLSLVPETWHRIARGVDPDTGNAFVIVARVKDGDVGTQWRMEYTINRNGRADWRCVSHTLSDGLTTVYPSPRNLSHSPIDTALRNYCEPGEWIGTEWNAA
jgi:hypothetical protein